MCPAYIQIIIIGLIISIEQSCGGLSRVKYCGQIKKQSFQRSWRGAGENKQRWSGKKLFSKLKNLVKQKQIETNQLLLFDYYKVIQRNQYACRKCQAALLINKQEQFQIELMTQSPTELIRKPQLEVFSALSSGIVDHHASPITNSQHEGRIIRMNYPINQPVTQGRKIFGYEIFVDNDILSHLQPEQEWFQKVKRMGDVQSIKFNLDLNIPDLNGRNIQIYDKQMDKKYQSCQVLLADIYQVFKKIRRESFSIIIFVPQGMVSLLIGTKGYQINKIMRESHTTIVVNQPINKMTYRTVKIQGGNYQIAKACRIIYQILEDKSSIAYSIQKQPSQLDYSKARVKTKFILCSSLLSYLMSKKKVIIKRVQEQTKCAIKFKENTSSSLLKRDQELCVLLGRLQDVQAFLVMLINLIQLYYDEDRKGHDYTFKMLIPSNYVTKLIGQKGYMIRDITQRSGGAQIKILSDRQSERDARECIISINGTRQNKIDATCLILEQIECFKNGGPILQSGKSINQNLAQQFKNSLPLHRCEEFFEQAEVTPKQEMIVPQKPKEAENIRPNLILDNDNHDQEGLISAQEGEQIHQSNIQKQVNEINDIRVENNRHAQNVSKQIIEAIEIEQVKQKQKQKIKQSNVRIQEKRILHSPSRKSAISGSSHSRSRKKSRRNTEMKANSSSSSPSYQQDKQYVQVKLVIPKKLAQDHKQLKYIQSLGHSEITIREQRIEGSSQAIISVRGSLKDNSQCIKLLQKRILRLTMHSSTR